MTNLQPIFSFVSSTGPDHCKKFEFELRINHNGKIKCFTGIGNTHKSAKQNASENALRFLQKK